MMLVVVASSVTVQVFYGLLILTMMGFMKTICIATGKLQWMLIKLFNLYLSLLMFKVQQTVKKTA